MNKSFFACALIVLVSFSAHAARGRKIASVLPPGPAPASESVKDCSAAINFKYLTSAIAGKVLKAKGFTGEFKNTEIETAKVSFRMTLDQPANENLEVKTELSELVVFDASGSEVWHSSIKPCGTNSACQAGVLKQTPSCKNGKLIIK